jgi:hypothetical protein
MAREVHLKWYYPLILQKNRNYTAKNLLLKNYRYLLYISGLDDTENRKIYETYMHSDQIAYIGKLCQDLVP